MKGRVIAVLFIIMMLGSMIAGCSGIGTKDGAADSGNAAAGSIEKDTDGKIEIQVFIAASLNTVMAELAGMYNEVRPEVKIIYNADSSGTLMIQIEEGYECDIFFSAAQKQMDQLEEDGLIMEGTRANVVKNQVVVVALKDSGTKVTGLENLEKAENIALAGGSVPVGNYTRQALMNRGILKKTEDSASVTTEQVSRALGGVEISEQDNAGKVLSAVIEGSCEVGTVYYSDMYGYENDLEILQKVDYELSGDVCCPVARVINDGADEARLEAAKDFVSFLLSDEAKEVFHKYYFDTDVER